MFGKPADADPEFYDLPTAEAWNSDPSKWRGNTDRGVDLKAGPSHFR